MPTLIVDGKQHAVPDGKNLLEACIEIGLNVPYFCWHPALGSVGACRQCAVKQYRDENDKVGRIVMSCMTPATEGTRITVDDSDSRAFRAAVIEWMMTSHPHDCPVCDEGGECHLQDMTLMTGHNYRRYRFQKRTFQNQDLGPLVNHEMNRCISCYRCVRFYRDHAGGRDLDAFAAHDHVYFGRHEDGVLESEFSGNLVEICPTGVFTDKTAKEHYTRRWDLTTAPSVCVHCSLGCNITPGERYGTLRRIRNRYNRAVNGYFLCDRGRYGYEFVNRPDRPRSPLKRNREDGGPAVAVTGEEAVRELGRLFTRWARPIGIGSPRASLEANFALRTLVGAENFYLGVSGGEHEAVTAALAAVRTGPARQPNLGELADHDAVFVLGEDLTNSAPLVALQLRQCVQNQPRAAARKLGIPDWNDLAVRSVIDVAKGPLYVAAPVGGKLDDVATEAVQATPERLVWLGHAVAHAIDPNAPRPYDLGPAADDAALQAVAGRIAAALRGAEKPLVVSGSSCASAELVGAAANVAWALCRVGKPAGLFLTAPECNSVGLELLGGGGALEDAVSEVVEGRADMVVVLENDLYRRADARAIDAMLDAARRVLVIDHTMHRTSERADFLLPATTFDEGDGTLVNSSGLAQRFVQVHAPHGDLSESWRWLARIHAAAGHGGLEEWWTTLDSLTAALAHEVPACAGVAAVAPPASFRVGGLKIPRQTHRFSGRTAMKAHVAVSETGVVHDPDSSHGFSMEGHHAETPAAMMSSFWIPGWNSAQAITRFQEEVNGPLQGGDPGVRLLEPSAEPAAAYHPAPAAAATTERGAFTVVARHHIFGSEELSVLSPGIAALAPKPYALLHAQDASELGVAEGDRIEIRIGDRALETTAALGPIARGLVALPVGVEGIGYVGLPANAAIRRLGAGTT